MSAPERDSESGSRSASNPGLLSRVMEIKPVAQTVQTFSQFSTDDGNLLAAAVAYYAALSFFPLMLVIVAGLALFFRFTELGQDAQQEVLSAVAQYGAPSIRDKVAEMLGRVQTEAAVGGPLGLVGLLVTAMALFAQFERAFDRIWDIKETEYRGIWSAVKSALFYRLRAFLMLLSVVVLMLLVFFAGMALSAARKYTDTLFPHTDWIWGVVQSLVTVTLNTFVFGVLYRYLPKAEVRWSEALRGGLLVSAVWELGRLVLASFVISDKYTAYGIIGSFLALMLWFYYAAVVIFLGAEYVQVICAECDHKEEKD